MAKGIQVFGVNKVIMGLQAKKIAVKHSTPMALATIGLHMEGEIKQSIAGRRAERASVDTGRFMGSITSKVDLSKKSVTISDGVKYGQFLEFGTTRLAPRNHFRNSLSRNKALIKKVLGQKTKMSLAMAGF